MQWLPHSEGIHPDSKPVVSPQSVRSIHSAVADIIITFRAMSRDPVAYPDPEEFRPERFLDPHARDPMKYAFGFGRRSAPSLTLSDKLCG